MPTKSIHLRLPLAHVRLLDKLALRMGFDRTEIIKMALYRLGLEEGLALEYRRDD